MNFEEVEIGLLNENREMPDKDAVLKCRCFTRWLTG